MTISDKKNSLVKTGLRIPSVLHVHLQEAADHNARSLNSEIIARLEASQVDAKLSEMAREIASIKVLLREILEK